MGIFNCDYPLQVRVEATQGCNRNCFYCGIHGIKDKSIKFMDTITFVKIINQLHEKTKRLDFELHGEPLLNKQILKFISYARESRPYLQITIISNIDIIIKKPELLNQLFDVGLNNLYCDLYDKESKDRFMPLLKNVSNIEIIDIYKQGGGPWGYKDSTNKKIFISDETDTENRLLRKSRKLHNFAGHVDYNIWKEYLNLTIDNFPIIRKCIEPFKSLSVAYNGDIFMCCGDFGKSLIFGNVNTDKIKDIWNNESINKIRYTLNQGRRDIIPTCYFCSRRMFRVGLYQYIGPKYKLLEINEEFSKKVKLQDSIINLFKKRIELRGVTNNAIYKYIL